MSQGRDGRPSQDRGYRVSGKAEQLLKYWIALPLTAMAIIWIWHVSRGDSGTNGDAEPSRLDVIPRSADEGRHQPTTAAPRNADRFIPGPEEKEGYECYDPTRRIWQRYLDHTSQAPGLFSHPLGCQFLLCESRRGDLLTTIVVEKVSSGMPAPLASRVCVYDIAPHGSRCFRNRELVGFAGDDLVMLGSNGASIMGLLVMISQADHPLRCDISGTGPDAQELAKRLAKIISKRSELTISKEDLA